MFRLLMKFLIISTFTFLLNIQYSFSADKVVINSDAGGRLIQAAMYPIYVIFLKGVSKTT